jgi:small subunit ribosomal protein S20
MIKKLRSTEDAKEAGELFPAVASAIDRLAKKNIIHKNKAANLKSSLQKYVVSLQG